MCDVLFPPTVYPQHKQGLLMSSHIKYPVRARDAHTALGYPTPLGGGAAVVYVPNFGDEALDSVFRATGGDPLADEDPETMCLVMTAPIPGVRDEWFRYGKVQTTRHGKPRGVEDGFDDERSSRAFVRGALEVQRLALATVSDHTADQAFYVVGAKLNTLAKGGCNIVMFVKFPGGCPFKEQTYLHSPALRSRTRVVPRPIIMPVREAARGYKVSLRFLSVDDELFQRAYALCRNVVTEDLGLHLRFIKCDAHRRCMVLCAQVRPGQDPPADMAALLRGVERKRNFRAAFTPYVYTGVEWEEVEL
jgi:hypothetical protein